MQKKSTKASGNKMTAFLKRNIYYVLMILCVLAIGTMITVAAIVNSTPDDTGVITPPDNKPGQETPVVKDFIISFPTAGKITNNYSEQGIDANGIARAHLAIDIAGKAGSNVIAPFDGVIKSIDKTENFSYWGMCITIDHQNGYTSVLKLLDAVNVTLNQKITKGEVIGTIIDSDKVLMEHKQGSHIHYEVMKDGKFIDPNQFTSAGNK